jgi:hypothetical protein
MSFDFFTHWRLRDIQRSVDHLRAAAQRPSPFAPQQADIKALQQEVGELRLLTAVLYRLLLDKGHLLEPDVHALIASLDAADGRRDGAFQGDPVSGEARSSSEPPEDDNPFPKIRVS